MFRKTAGQIAKEKEIEEFQKKCNFLDGDGHCDLCLSYLYSRKCDFEKCIFMKILNKEPK